MPLSFYTCWSLSFVVVKNAYGIFIIWLSGVWLTAWFRISVPSFLRRIEGILFIWTTSYKFTWNYCSEFSLNSLLWRNRVSLFFSPSSESSASRREYRVGQYVVDLVSFEQLVLPMLRNVSILWKLLRNVCFIIVSVFGRRFYTASFLY